MSKVTIIKVRELLRYDPKTGVFTWRTDRVCGRGRVSVRSGSVAGTQRPNGYRLININGTPILEHRLAWLYHFGEWPRHHIDHINGNPSDNRIANLRDVPRQVNMQNMRHAMSGKKHGSMLGTAWHEGTGKWRALIKIDARQCSLGYFDTEAQAHEAYVVAKRRYHEGCTI